MTQPPAADDRLARLLHLRDQVDQHIRDERARLARHDGLVRRLPIDLTVRPELIVPAVCTEFQITAADLLGPSHERHLSEARAAGAWIARDAGIPPRVAAELLHLRANYVSSLYRRVEGIPLLLHRATTIRDRAIATNQDAA